MKLAVHFILILQILIAATVNALPRATNNLSELRLVHSIKSVQRSPNNVIDVNETLPSSLRKNSAPISNSEDISNAHRRWMEFYLTRKTGGVGDGGGDPRAYAALDYGKKVLGFLYPSLSAQLQINRFELAARIEYILLSLDTKRPLLVMNEDHDVRCFGEIKKGCTQTDASIEIAGVWWDQSTTTEHDKCFTSVVELLRPLQIIKIYEVGAQLCTAVLNGTSFATAVIAPSTETPVDICERPRTDVKKRLSLCEPTFGIGYCLRTYWAPYFARHQQCAIDDFKFCYDTCEISFGGGYCLKWCDGPK